MYYKINGITYGSVGISYIVTTLVTLINNNHVSFLTTQIVVIHRLQTVKCALNDYKIKHQKTSSGCFSTKNY